VRDEVVQHVLSHPFFQRPSPKTTGREDFGAAYADELLARFAALAEADLVRSAVAATAACIVDAARAHGATEILLTGGGAKNPTLEAEVRARAPSTPVVIAEDGVFAASCHEPAAMALIAARTLRGLPSNLPAVTGASRPVVLGHLARP
jgi:anhydro-N-acetylmuramic acid kinase